MEIGGQLHSPSEIAGALQADPERLGTRRAIALAAPMAPQAGDPAEHRGQRGWRDRRGPAMNRDIDRLPFGRVQDGVAGQLGGGPTQHGQVLNPPSDDEIQGQGRFPAVSGC